MVPPATLLSPGTPPGTPIRRHAIATRLWHWVNAIALLILLGSGLGISNAHPRLYWGRYGANFDHAWATLPHFPGWLTIPAGYNLAISRRWHLFFALVLAFGLLAYMVASLLNRHFRRDLALRREDVSARHLAEDVRDHLAFRFHDADDPGRYNSLQKWSYIAVVFVALPLMIASGLALSPGMDAGWPWLLTVFGGRQSARSVHFVAATLLGGFTIVHLALVILAGTVNEVRSMISGWWRVPA
jgi:Ni/Fe-hydrogenase b-type cytochrome subunit